VFTDIEITYQPELPSGSVCLSLSTDGKTLCVYASPRWQEKDDAALLALDPYVADAITAGLSGRKQSDLAD
jgi:hypothetical protein